MAKYSAAKQCVLTGDFALAIRTHSPPYDIGNGATGIPGEFGANKYPIDLYSPLTDGRYYTQASTPSMAIPFIIFYIDGNRQDWGNSLGLPQVLSENSLVELGLGFTHSSSFLSNPYKAVYVFTATVPSDQDPNQPMLYSGGYMEARPHKRNQITGNLGYQYHLEPLDSGKLFATMSKPLKWTRIALPLLLFLQFLRSILRSNTGNRVHNPQKRCV